MAPFTYSRDPAIERCISGQVSYIGKQIIEAANLDRPFALLLAGGFGRGEGAAKRWNGRVVVQNDYDLELIVDVSLPSFLRLYRQMRRRLGPRLRDLAQELGVKQIDLGIRNLRLLQRGVRTIALYELASAHHQIAGDSEIAARLPSLSPALLPLTEGSRLLLNRGGGLLLAAAYFTSLERLAPAELENFEIELTKAILSCGDLWLLERGLYHYSYVTRATRLRQAAAFGHGSRLGELYRRAIEYKLRWVHWLESCALMSQWVEIRDLFLDCWKAFEFNRLGRSFSDWGEYYSLRKPRHDPLLLEVGRELGRMCSTRGEWSRLARRVRRGREVYLLSVLPALLSVVTEDGLNVDEVAFLEPKLGDDEAQESWVRLTGRFLELWHAQGEAGRVAALLRSRHTSKRP